MPIVATERRPLRGSWVWLFSVAMLGISVENASAQDVIRGRVSGAGNAPLAGATVTLTPAGSAARPTTTKADGTFSITVTPRANSYTVAASFLGYAPQTRTVSRTGADSVIVVDFALTAVAAQLPRVQSVGARPRAARADAGFDNSIGGQISFVDLSKSMSGDLTGDLNSALSLVPGISLTPGASGGAIPSILGVPGDQSNVTLNGLLFSGNIPRDGFRVGVITSAYDAGRGGFAGTQTALRMATGANLITKNAHATLDAPALQATTPDAARLGSEFSQQVVSGQVFGPIKLDKSFYSIAYQGSRRQNDLPSILSASPATLAAWHVSSDSIARLIAGASTLGIPVRPPGAAKNRESLEGRLAVRLDYSPNASPNPVLTSPITAVSDDYFVEFGGSWRRNDGTLIAPTSVPSVGADQTHADGWFVGTISKYLQNGLLTENSVSFNAGRDRLNPYVHVPTARVLIPSVADGATSVASYALGGSSAVASTLSTASAQLRSQTNWVSWDRHHTVAMTGELGADNISSDRDPDAGAFSFNSLSDFLANRPATFTRSLTSQSSHTTTYQAAFGVGDQYQPSSLFRVQYGLRAEGNMAGARAASDAHADAVFGIHTHDVPTSIALLPMAGFAWQTLGYIQLPQIGNAIARGFITGGIREYRGTMSARSVDDALRRGSVAGQVFCAGDATPIPTWSTYAASSGGIPTACRTGDATLANAATPVSLVGDDYRPIRSWRANANASYRLNLDYQISVGGSYALNRDLAGAYDLNVQPTARFSLANEAGRPVFVPAANVVSGTGAVTWAGSRVNSQFSHVTETRGGLRGNAGAINLGISYSPFSASGSFNSIGLNYIGSSGREETWGFGGTTAGDPTERTWSPIPVPTHTVIATFSRKQDRLGTIGVSMRAQSGVRFTPTVAGDINGDGYSNDRAFIFSPSTAPDAASAAALTKLFADAPSTVRDCLARQAGTIAGRNSCAAPWSIPLFTIALSPEPARLHFGNRGSANLYLINVLAGLDQALHGSSGLRGWGQWSVADPTLLTVRGFDAATKRYQYSVNPLFGSSTVYRAAFRAPFAMTVDFRVEVGPDRESQLISGALRTRTGQAPDSLAPEVIKARIDRAQNPFRILTAQLRDSVKLTQPQVDSITRISERYARGRDSVMTSLTRFLSAQHGDYSSEAVREQWHGAARTITASAATLAKAVAAQLTEAQRERLTQLQLATQLVQLIDLDPNDLSYTLRLPVSTQP